MATHWIYEDDVPEDGPLQQGDILGRSPILMSLLREVHTHFTLGKYTSFLVLSQTCDLTLRKGQQTCAAPYITIAVIRQLDEYLPEVIENSISKPLASRVFPAGASAKVNQLIDRLIDQNEQKLGLFYLHPDLELGIGKPSVAVLRVSIALRNSHYQTLQGSRVGRVSGQYVAKLGWLCGNLFDRVATEDWKDRSGEQATKDAKRGILGPRDYAWVDEEAINRAREDGFDFAKLTVATATRQLKEYLPPKRKELALGAIEHALDALISSDKIDDKSRKAVINKLRSDPGFGDAVK